MSIYLYKDNATELYVFKYKGFVFNPKPGSMMLIERESDGFVNLQAVYDNKAFRQNTNGHILNDFVDPELILDGTGTAYGAAASDILTALSDFFVDAPASTGATDLLGGIAHNAAAPTPGVSGKYYFTSAGVCTWLPGSPTVAVGDTVLVVFNDPTYTYVYVPVAYELLVNKKQTVTNSATDYPSGAAVTASLALKTDIAELNKIYPLYNYNVRVGTDFGSIGNIEELAKLYNENLALLDSTVFLWSGVSGMKTRTSGSNVFASKLYNMANKVQLFGSELVTNGTFTGADGSTPAGWTGSNAILTIDGNRLKITNTSTGYGVAMQSIQTIIGKTYHFTFSQQNGDSQAIIYLGTTNGSSNVYTSGVLNNASSITRTISFIAQSTTTYIYAFVYNTGIGNYTFFDNISVKQMDWIEGTNDAIQTTEANQPYVGGVIAPNEVRKLKSYAGNNNILPFSSAITFAANDDRTFTIITDIDRYGADDSFLTFSSTGNTNYFKLTKTTVNYSIAGSSTTTAQRLSTYKKALITVVYKNGNVSIYENGVLIRSSTITLNQVGFNMIAKLYPSTGHILEHFQLFNKALSASEIQAQHEYLRLQIPEIEGIAIGNQYWATSNYEGVVAGDGSVIPEVQNSDNAAMLVGGDFSSSTGWVLNSSEILDGKLNIFSTSTINVAKKNLEKVSTINRYYKISFEISSYVSGQVRISGFGASTDYTGANGSYLFYIKATTSGAAAAVEARIGVGGFIGSLDNLLIEEVGWSQSTALYDAIYAQTSGTAAQKELAALKAAAMWCYYNNDVNIGATRGKIINDYAKALIALYPPVGYRVPSEADVNQLVAYNGGSSVAGGKLKKEGFGYWNSPNTGATNESGFSAIAGGSRAADGTFGLIDSQAFFGIATSSNRLSLTTSATTTTIIDEGRERGYSLRLLRNSPVGPNENTVTTGTIVNALGAGNLDIVIPFGYAVDSIKVISRTGITGLSAKYCSRNPSTLAVTELDTLFTAKTVVADTPKLFNCNVDQTIQRQDAVVRINGTKADTAAEFEVRVNIKKAIL